MPLIRPPLVKKKLLKLVLATDNPKSIEFGLRYVTYNKTNNTLALYYRTKVIFLKLISLLLWYIMPLLTHYYINLLLQRLLVLIYCLLTSKA
jgi:hypothetical protein